MLIPEVQDCHKVKSSQNPMTHKNLMLQCFNQFSTPVKKHDAPVSMKLPANSPYCPVEKHRKIHLREHNILPTEDGLMTDVRIKYT